MTTALAPAPALREDLRIGGRYTAIDNNDGTFDIQNVAVFAEVPAGVKRNKDHIGRDWQEAAILKNKFREREGHLPPVHVYHTDNQNIQPIYAGKLRLKYTKQVIYQGERIWATFGDILGMPAAVFNERVRPGFLPYRSVEIHNWDTPEIDSLALMDTDVPYFRMEMLTIGDVIKRFRKNHELFMGRPQPVVALRAVDGGSSMAILFKFGDKDKKDKDGAPDPKATSNGDSPPDPESYGGADIKGKPVRKNDDEAKGVGFEKEGAKEVPPDADDKGENASTIEGAPGEESEMPLGDEAAAPGAEEAGMAADAAPAWAQQMLSMMKQFLDRLAPAPPQQDPLEPVSGFRDTEQETESEESLMADEKKIPAAPAPITMKADELAALIEGATLKAITPLKQELADLRKENDDVKKKATAKAKFDAVMAGMGRRNIDDGVKKSMLRMAELGMDDDLKQVSEGLKLSVPEDPAPDADTFESDLAAGTMDSGAAGTVSTGDPEAAEFCAKNPGPKAVRFVKEERVKFNAYRKAASGQTDLTFGEWLRDNWRSANMFSANKV